MESEESKAEKVGKVRPVRARPACGEALMPHFDVAYDLEGAHHDFLVHMVCSPCHSSLRDRESMPLYDVN